MSIRSNQIEKLKTDLAAGRVVTIVGTGVSVAATQNQTVDGFPVATWTGLLRHGAKHCHAMGRADDDDLQLIQQQIDLGTKPGKVKQLVNAATEITERLKGPDGDGVFRAWLEDTVGKLTHSDPSVTDAIAALPGMLATLNYDHLLEQTTGFDSVTWQEADRVQDLLRGAGPSAVLHLHGSYRAPDSVVFGRDSYKATQNDPHSQAVRQLFTLDRTLFMVGCGGTIDDPNFETLIQWAKVALKDVKPRHFLLCLKEHLESLQKRLNQDAPWLQPLAYDEGDGKYSELAPFLRSLAPVHRVRPRPQPNMPASFAMELDRYRDAMRKKYARIKLEDVDTTTHDIRQVLVTGMFIEQAARECVDYLPQVYELPKELQRQLRERGEFELGEFHAEVLERHRRSYLEQPPRPILEIVRDANYGRLVVLGDPGSGKSMLLQYLALEWAEATPANSAAMALPLLIELREYARARYEKSAYGFLSFLHKGVGVPWHLDETELYRWLKSKSSLVLFDGLDEVFDHELRREIRNAIHRFADEYPLARIIVTSRVIGFQHQTWRDQGFRHVMLQELNGTQIAEFLNRWHRALYDDGAMGSERRERLSRAIWGFRAMHQLAGNPLLLTMMTILNSTQELPQDRPELYEQCVKLLLHQWKVELAFTGDSELEKASLDYKNKRSLLLGVARRMQASAKGLAGNLICEDALEAALAEELIGFPNIRPDRAARALIEQLRGRNFMLSSVGSRNYGFVHRTFLEYFCASEIRERFEKALTLSIEQLKTEVFAHWIDEAWHEVLRLLAGMLDVKVVGDLLNWLIEQNDTQGWGNNIFLAAECLGEVRNPSSLSDISERIRERTIELIRFDINYYYDEWQEEGRLVAKRRARAVETVAAVWRGASKTRDWLAHIANDSDSWTVRQSAVQELARGWKDDPETLPWLKDRARYDWNWDVRRSAVQELAWGWKNDPETLPLLKDRARIDENDYVRQSAVQELARRGKHDPETRSFLMDRARIDENKFVRRSAVQELARGWKDDPDTLAWLKDRARSDENNYVRQSAIQELVRGWKDDPDTLPILNDCVRNDEDPIVRQSALQELARGWRVNPNTLPFLKDRARNDEHSDVRQIAVQELAWAWKHDPDTLPILKVSVRNDEHSDVRQVAMQELVRSWKVDPDVLTVLKDRARNDENYGVRRSAVQELAWGWKDDRDTLSILRDRALNDGHYGVRRSAVHELARGWKDDPDLLQWLKDRARNDEDPDVLQSTMQELARGWKHDPDTLPILKERARNDKNVAVRVRAVRELARGWKDDPDTLPILKDNARNGKNAAARQSGLRELARGWKNDPDTLPIVKERARNDDDYNVRRNAIRELVSGWKDDPDTFLVLKVHARNDENPEVRLSALRELARGWKHDPNTHPFLTDRARTDEDAVVRLGALRELARVWKDDPGTVSILKDRARNDGNGAVRHGAVLELVRGWKHSPDALPILKDRARYDGHGPVRQGAVRELAWGWKDDPDTLPILKNRARNDTDNDVRQSAVHELARHWKDDPDMLLIIKDRALHDRHWAVRYGAMRELSQGWKDDPDTLRILIDRAKNDKYRGVSEGAKRELAWGWRDDPEVQRILTTLEQSTS